MAYEHRPAGHAGADPATRISEHDRGAARHVLEGEALHVAADDDLGARKTDAGARIGGALHVEAAPLRAVGEALADGAVDMRAACVAGLQHRDDAAQRGLRRAVLSASGEREPHAVRRVCREAIAGDRAVRESGHDVGGARVRDASSRERARVRRRDEALARVEARLARDLGCGRDEQRHALGGAAPAALDRREQRRQVDPVEAPRLLEQIGPSH